jgi:Uma2 family endonuclease
MYDLPSDNPEDSGLPDEFHGLQPQLLSLTLHLSQYSRQEIFTAFDLNLYYDSNQPGWYKRPDWFLVVGVPRLYEGKTSRFSYVVWDEQVAPIVIVEFLSPGTEAEDLGRFTSKPIPSTSGKPPSKFEVYEQILQVPHYIVYNEQTEHLRYFWWVNGVYQEQTIAPTNPRLWIPELALGLGLWLGEYRDLPQTWLRWCDADGTFIPTDTEAALARAASERAATAAAQRQIAQGVVNLLQMGLTTAQVAQALGLSELDVQRIATEQQNP